MSAEAFMNTLSEELGESIVLNDQNNVSLKFDEKNMFLQWQEQSQTFIVHVEIGYLRGWRDDIVCRQLLAANFLLMETNGATLSCSMATNSVGINYPIYTYGMDEQSFLLAINNILLLADQWAENLRNMSREQEKKAQLLANISEINTFNNLPETAMEQNLHDNLQSDLQSDLQREIQMLRI